MILPTCISTSPVIIFLLTASCGLAITMPEIPITSSKPSFFAILNEESFFCSSKTTCVIGLVCDATRLSDVRRNRIQSMHEDRPSNYTNEKEILNELENSKKLFKKYNWPILDVTRKSVEETAASIIKILDILNSR